MSNRRTTSSVAPNDGGTSTGMGSSIGGSAILFKVTEMQAPGFLAPSTRSKRPSTGEDIDLKLRLKALCQWLQGLDQDYAQENLDEIAKQLVERQLLKHNDKVECTTPMIIT